MKLFKQAAFISMVFLITACGVTKIQDQSITPVNGVAYLKGIPGWNPLYAAGIQIYRIDGNKVSQRNNTYELSPGSHQFSVRCTIDQPEFVSKSYVFKIDMVVGHTYQPKMDMTQQCGLYFIDAQTHQRYDGLLN